MSLDSSCLCILSFAFPVVGILGCPACAQVSWCARVAEKHMEELAKANSSTPMLPALTHNSALKCLCFIFTVIITLSGVQNMKSKARSPHKRVGCCTPAYRTCSASQAHILLSILPRYTVAMSHPTAALQAPAARTDGSTPHIAAGCIQGRRQYSWRAEGRA